MAVILSDAAYYQNCVLSDKLSADMVELADTQVLGTCAACVWVRVPLSAPNRYNPNLFPIGDGFGLFIFFFQNGVQVVLLNRTFAEHVLLIFY